MPLLRPVQPRYVPRAGQPLRQGWQGQDGLGAPRFPGPDSVEAARAALAAGEQNRYWPYYSLLFDNQGEENSGYVTANFLQDLAHKTPGLDVSKWNTERTENSFSSELQAAQSNARSGGVDSTPTLIVSGPGGKKKLVGVHNYGQISQAIDQVDGS